MMAVLNPQPGQGMPRTALIGQTQAGRSKQTQPELQRASAQQHQIEPAILEKRGE